jgi:hypothetical protein
MPETFGKRERKKVQERKAQARDDRRIARNRRRQGLPVDMPYRDPFAQPVDLEPLEPPVEDQAQDPTPEP